MRGGRFQSGGQRRSGQQGRAAGDSACTLIKLAARWLTSLPPLTSDALAQAAHPGKCARVGCGVLGQHRGMLSRAEGVGHLWRYLEGRVQR